jgi:hypothetical protein
MLVLSVIQVTGVMYVRRVMRGMRMEDVMFVEKTARSALMDGVTSVRPGCSLMMKENV